MKNNEGAVVTILFVLSIFCGVAAEGSFNYVPFVSVLFGAIAVSLISAGAVLLFKTILK